MATRPLQATLPSLDEQLANGPYLTRTRKVRQAWSSGERSGRQDRHRSRAPRTTAWTEWSDQRLASGRARLSSRPHFCGRCHHASQVGVQWMKHINYIHRLILTYSKFVRVSQKGTSEAPRGNLRTANSTRRSLQFFLFLFCPFILFSLSLSLTLSKKRGKIRR